MKNLIVQAQKLDASGDEQVRQWFKRRCRRAVYSCSVLLVRALTDTISYAYKRYRSSFSPLLLVLKVHRRGIQLSCNPSGLLFFFSFLFFSLNYLFQANCRNRRRSSCIRWPGSVWRGPNPYRIPYERPTGQKQHRSSTCRSLHQCLHHVV